MNDFSREHSAYRAAGQAVAALLHGAPLIQIDVDGVEVGWSDEPDDRRPRAEILADIAIGLAGVAAEEYFRFGCPPPECRSSLTFYSFNESQIADLAEVAELVALLDADASADVNFQAFRQAHDLIAEPNVWSTVECLAVELLRRDVSVQELSAILAAPDRSGEFNASQPHQKKRGFDVD